MVEAMKIEFFQSEKNGRKGISNIPAVGVPAVGVPAVGGPMVSEPGESSASKAPKIREAVVRHKTSCS